MCGIEQEWRGLVAGGGDDCLYGDVVRVEGAEEALANGGAGHHRGGLFFTLSRGAWLGSLIGGGDPDRDAEGISAAVQVRAGIRAAGGDLLG